MKYDVSLPLAAWLLADAIILGVITIALVWP